MKCGYGTAVFLIMMSSSIFIIRGEKASVWGSVYLDAFGEEDIDLRSVLQSWSNVLGTPGVNL